MEDSLQDNFTVEEKRLINPYFTNLDKPIFALTNLPEVVKGALFSRYSRSAKSLRRVLLDEFIKQPEMGFNEIVGHLADLSGHSSEKGKSQIIAIKKAEEFYERVLVGYGDDSVAELGGASIACEQISQIAAKFIEGARIGISPLEKSTRYVWFNQKPDGKYQYYREPVLMDSEFAGIYEETCDMLFDNYSMLMEPMKKFFMERFPQEDASDRAYNSAIRAKVCDVLRVFLPASTLTNVGLYGNGRAFEYLLTKMYAHPLSEIRNLAKGMNDELNLVIPSFVKRCDDIYGKSAQEFISGTCNSVRNFVSENISSQPKLSEEVSLADYDNDAEIKVMAGILYPQTNLSMEEARHILQGFSDEKKKELLSAYVSQRKNRRHKPGRAFENCNYQFDICTNYGIYRDLQRHRVLTQEAQDLTVVHGYDTPKELCDAGFEKQYHDCMDAVKNTYGEIYRKFPKEAQYVVSFGHRIRWYMRMNLREVFHLTELRSMQQGHPDYRRVAQKIFLKVKEVHPSLAEGIKFVDMNSYGLERIEAEKKTDKKLDEIRMRFGN